MSVIRIYFVTIIINYCRSFILSHRRPIIQSVPQQRLLGKSHIAALQRSQEFRKPSRNAPAIDVFVCPDWGNNIVIDITLCARFMIVNTIVGPVKCLNIVIGRIHFFKIVPFAIDARLRNRRLALTPPPPLGSTLTAGKTEKFVLRSTVFNTDNTCILCIILDFKELFYNLLRSDLFDNIKYNITCTYLLPIQQWL